MFDAGGIRIGYVLRSASMLVTGYQIRYPVVYGSYPTIYPMWDLESHLHRFSFSIATLTGDLKIFRCAKLGFDPKIRSNGVMPLLAHVGDLLRRYAIVLTATDHKFLGNFDAYIIACAPSVIVQIARSATPFCS